MKTCEICKVEIPEEYGNALCLEHYREMEAKANAPVMPQNALQEASEDRFGITDPSYQFNPQMEDKEQYEANMGLFQKYHILLWKPTRTMYTFIKTYNLNKITQHPQYPKFIWKPRIVDVGCGSGVGSNVLSQEADFVWGIDKNATSIAFAKEAFTREKNGIYYSSQVTFDNLDIMEDTREFMQFDQVVAIEVIEHIYDTWKFLETLVKKFTKRNKKGNVVRDDPTEFWFSSPNRNNDSIRKDKPYNQYHVREWTSGELLDVLSKYFEKVEMYNSAGVPIPKDEYRTTTHTPLLFKAELSRL